MSQFLSALARRAAPGDHEVHETGDTRDTSPIAEVMGEQASRNETLWNIARCRGLFRLDVCELHDLPPLLGFIGKELAEVGW